MPDAPDFEDSSAQDALDEVETRTDRDRIFAELDALDPRVREVLMLRFGLGPDEPEPED